MDGDPTVERELDTFSLILPLPYRVAIIIVLGMSTFPDYCAALLTLMPGVWAWAINLHYLSILKIVCAIFRTLYYLQELTILLHRMWPVLLGIPIVRHQAGLHTTSVPIGLRL